MRSAVGLRSMVSFSVARLWRGVAGDFLRDLALDGEQIVQIAIVLLRPYMRVSARVDQLRIDVKPCPDPTDAALQNVRYP